MTSLPRHPFAWQAGQPALQFENPWMRVDRFPAIDPSGQPTDYGVVHFKNLAVGVVPYADGHVWLVGQSRFALRNYSWEIPAGGGAHDEDPAEAARRELREETGLRAGKLAPILTLELSNSITDERGIVFLATDLTLGETEMESSEDISLMKISLDDALAAVDAGEIRQALSVAALLKLDRMRGAGQL